MAKDEALAPPATTAVAKPDDISQYVTPTRPEGGDAEGLLQPIAREDVAMPRLGIAQKTSKELDPTDPRYIEGLKFTDLFHTGDKRTFGGGPVLFTVLRYYPPRFIEFRPLDEGGGIVDKDVHPNDARTQFTLDDRGNTVKPVATKFLDYVIMMLNGFDPSDPMKNVVALSFKSSGLAAAKSLNHLIQFRSNKTLFRGVYQLTSAVDKNSKGSFAVYKVANAGWLAEGTPAFNAAQDFYESLKHETVEVERDQHDDPDSFEPAKYDGQAVGSNAAGM